MVYSECRVSLFWLILFTMNLFIWMPLSAYATEIEQIKIFKDRLGVDLVLERESNSNFLRNGIERIQFRDKSGRIIAYTPVRVTGIPFCISKKACWVFMWKTVYPLPAIFKFNPNPLSWTKLEYPPFRYGRGGIATKGITTFEGFDEQFNPLFGLFGTLLLLQQRILFFLGLIVLTMILFLQISKYREMPAMHQAWIRRLISIAFAIIHMPVLFAEPYTVTAILLLVLAVFGMIFAGVPIAISMPTSIITFLICAVLVAKRKRNQV